MNYLSLNKYVRINNRILALVAGILLSIGSLNAETFGRIVSLGDSLADTGNIHELTDEELPRIPNFEGRFSNGIVWPEHLAQDLGVTLIDHAYGGAFTDDRNLNEYSLGMDLPGLSDQVDEYLENSTPEQRQSDLITIVVGSNDMIFYLQMVSQGIPVSPPVPNAAANALGHVSTLISSGAQNIVVLAIPDMSSTPLGSVLSEDLQKQFKEVLKAHNQILKKGLYDLRKATGVDIVFVNIFEELNKIIASPADYGLTDTSTPGMYVYQYFPVDTYLFWDAIHPTTTGHRLLADAVFDALVDHYEDE